MKLEEAIKIAKAVAHAKKKWGKQASPPYTVDQLMDAVTALDDAGRFDAPSDEEITKLRRQLAACQNREKARTGKDA